MSSAVFVVYCCNCVMFSLAVTLSIVNRQSPNLLYSIQRYSCWNCRVSIPVICILRSTFIISLYFFCLCPIAVMLSVDETYPFCYGRTVKRYRTSIYYSPKTLMSNVPFVTTVVSSRIGTAEYKDGGTLRSALEGFSRVALGVRTPPSPPPAPPQKKNKKQTNGSQEAP